MAAFSLVIQEKPQVWITVNLKAPIDGAFVDVQIELLVELETRDKITAMVTKSIEGNISIDQMLFETTVKGWRGIGSSDDKELKFNKPNLKKVMSQAYILEPCAAALMHAHRGIVEEQEKN